MDAAVAIALVVEIVAVTMANVAVMVVVVVAMIDSIVNAIEEDTNVIVMIVAVVAVIDARVDGTIEIVVDRRQIDAAAAVTIIDEVAAEDHFAAG